jgi:hypothetical protein
MFSVVTVTSRWIEALKIKKSALHDKKNPGCSDRDIEE